LKDASGNGRAAVRSDQTRSTSMNPTTASNPEKHAILPPPLAAAAAAAAAAADVARPSFHHLFCLYMSITMLLVLLDQVSPPLLSLHEHHHGDFCRKTKRRREQNALVAAPSLTLSVCLSAEAPIRQRGPPSAGAGWAARANVGRGQPPPLPPGLPPDKRGQEHNVLPEQCTPPFSVASS
jgi:hypothetical protein